MAKKTYECLAIPPLINFSFFSTLDIPIPPQSINYWGTFLTLTNFLKQYTYTYFLAILQQEGSVFIVFCFLGSNKEANLLPVTELIL